MSLISIEKGNVVVSVYELMGSLGKEHRDQIIDALACTDEVIDQVMNQVLDGYTTMGSHAAKGDGGSAYATYGIDGARRRIAMASSDIAKKQIEALTAAVKRANDSANEAWNKYHEARTGWVTA